MSVHPLTVAPSATEWSVERSAELYAISSWGEPYFCITPKGHVGVRAADSAGTTIDVVAVVEEIRRRGVQFPVLARFQDVLRAQVHGLNRAFAAAIEEAAYDNVYRGVYPIKVNQLHEVVEEILDAGSEYGLGLECGSKAELIAALPHLSSDDTLLICNGVKDQTMLSLMIAAQRLGKNVLPVVEKLTEYSDLKTLAWQKGFVPKLGARIRLATEGSGRWASSSGLSSKFGLSTSELLRLVDELDAGGLLDKLTLLHCHLGSQVADIQILKQAVKEVTQVYADLVQRGVGLEYLDVGGGLGVSYDESQHATDSSINYDMQEYANAVVFTVKEVCDGQGVPAPVLISESGRAITAHHSALLVPVLSAQGRDDLPGEVALPSDAHQTIVRLHRTLEEISELTTDHELLEAFHDAQEKQEEARALFTLGYLRLEQRALSDQLFWTICRRLLTKLKAADLSPAPPELRQLEELLTDQYLCDFSVFQSMLDHWAIGQPFPIMPIDRLDEYPSCRGVLVDLTCDSDGKVSHYVSSHPDKSFLPIHALEPNRTYYLGFFLMGAYEDIVGDAHNLFGRVSEVHVYADPEEPENFWIEKIIPGTAVQDMLAQVQYFPNDLHRRMSELVRVKIQEGVVRPTVGMEILDQYMACLQQNTYCDPGDLGQDPS
jgi:arginine decarboxylase